MPIMDLQALISGDAILSVISNALYIFKSCFQGPISDLIFGKKCPINTFQDFLHFCESLETSDESPIFYQSLNLALSIFPEL